MAERKWRHILRVATRRRRFQPELVASDTSLRRCLNCWDLTSLGVGSTLGIGVYVLVGAVALKTAGPSILLSFLIAAVTSLFAALCYAELGARVPLAGSAFIYTYVTVGEMVAFMVGWNNILEFIFGSASVARGLSAYIDAVCNHAMSEWLTSVMPISDSYAISSYFDLFSFLFVLAMGVVMSFGVRESSTVNNVFSAINILVIIFIVFAGSFKANSDNWNIPADQVPEGFGTGGFFPYGVWGTLKGAAICFYGFVGFDVVNSSGEEVKEPKKTIPIAILSILFIVFAAYAGVSIVVTMMVPYYEMVAVASVSTAFRHVGWEWARWIVTVGAVFGISTSLFGALFPLPRLLYSMANDGLFIHWFGKVSRRKSPIIATVVPTAIISILAAFLELEQLVLMMCIGTLCSYTIVATCVILLRHRSDYVPEVSAPLMKQIIGLGGRTATKTTSRVINVAMVVYLCICLTIALVVVNAAEPLIPAIILHVFMLLTVLVMAVQPSSDEKLAFKTPLVPFIPCLSIYTNVHLMVIINIHTWIRVIIWILLGIPIYFICINCYKQNAGKTVQDDPNNKSHINKNGKSPTVQIVVESPTPPRTMAGPDEQMQEYDDEREIHRELKDQANQIGAKKIDEIIVQQVQVENNEEKEAKIIDLLDQVLQAEEDTYSEVISLKETKEDDSTSAGVAIIPHRKSLSELSDAESEASLGNQVLSKYDVIAQVHREDLPKVSEEEERMDNNEDNIPFEDEEITAFNDSDTNSRTDESGYSDTIDRQASESLDEPAPNIPPPPPFDENFFKSNYTNYNKFYTVNAMHPKRETPQPEDDDEELTEPRVSVQSNNSQSDGNMRFGSDRQIKFMSKLNNIFQKNIPNDDEVENEPRRRSHSTGNAPDIEQAVNRDRPSLFLDLKKELLSRDAAQNLRPVNPEVKPPDEKVSPRESDASEPEPEEDQSLSRADLKNKLENIFAVGGPQLIKPRLMKSNPPTPDDSNVTDQSSTESIAKLPKMDKNDTLKRQRAKFSEVLNSFRFSMNADDKV
ncbi:high affinity cationic amino acid transporter 1 [Spodoptera frugiperda]|uniref:High affinity cationic amino acid transporter 1 n=2 Tax=Spodoptera frugiperda TaxID=7108 RepID=A0A9R0DWH6_SPOFR|nr:high affinity cationic amino acid transporter 1 [Spodoptera frugiperda]XP_035440160.2 high affinity cationic amino acid transporter 1 [Spodoptera frugiperda]XP_050554945.1 high affinity cationic amino acid transporter 1 [Spodoptera frugiperda]XP_050554947.1 high affinity cationic amino acid transporter 1 [Spodoptera frugiperda]